MPRLILKFDARELQEFAVGTRPVSIGRLPDNTIVIDNPAISGRTFADRRRRGGCVRARD
jgi:hypothetical protein